MKRMVFLIIFALTVVGYGYSADRRAFTIDDLYRIHSVGAAEYSKDGKRIVYTVTVRSLKESTERTHIWIMNADGSNARQLTFGEKSEYSPVWSADGKEILFLSNRKDGSQMWSISPDGGEAVQLTSIGLSMATPTLNFDGSRIVFSADVFPECGADVDANNKINDAMARGPIHAHMADKLLYRHWTEYSDGRVSHLIVYDFAAKTLTDLTPGDFETPTFSLGGAGGFSISPDGKEVCFVSNHDPHPESSTNSDLWIVPIGGGPLVNITRTNPAADTDPQYSPDGKFIAYRMQEIPGYESDRFRLAIYDRAAKTSRVLTESFDNWVDAYNWSSDSKSILFQADVEGASPIYRIDVATGTITPIIRLGGIGGFSISKTDGSLVFPSTTVGAPVELYRVDADGKNLKQLTTENKFLTDEVDVRPAETMWVDGAGGAKVEVFIVKPHNFDPSKKYPLILNVHGGPQMQWMDSFRGDWQVYPGAGYVVAFPNPHGSTGYGQTFTAEISKDWGGMVYEDCMKVTDALEKLPYIDKDRIGAMGWSYGGYMMDWMLGHTNRFKAIASMMGVFDLSAMYGSTEELWFPEWELNGKPWESDLYQKWNPASFIPKFKTPTLVITGEKDYRVPYTQSLELFTGLQKMGVPSRLIVFPNDGHWPNNLKSMPLYYNAHLDWFHRYLGGDPAPYDMTKMVRNLQYEK